MSHIQWVSAPCWTSREMAGLLGGPVGRGTWVGRTANRRHALKQRAQNRFDFLLWQKARLSMPSTGGSLGTVFRVGWPSQPLSSCPHCSPQGSWQGRRRPIWYYVTQHQELKPGLRSKPGSQVSQPLQRTHFFPLGGSTCREPPGCGNAGHLGVSVNNVLLMSTSSNTTYVVGFPARRAAAMGTPHSTHWKKSHSCPKSLSLLRRDCRAQPRLTPSSAALALTCSAPATRASPSAHTASCPPCLLGSQPPSLARPATPQPPHQASAWAS